ncbi:MAG TPA: 3-deoxy-D-manno-octulosonic acid transferase [Candidatus Binatia bacterium]
MLYWIYNVEATLGLLLGFALLPLWLVLGKRYREGFFQRLGFYPRALRASIRGARPIWLHAASVGEVLAARALADALKSKFPERKIVLSTFTSTGRDVARRSVAADLFVFLPLDHPWIVGRALAVFDPCILIVLETELWPNLLRLSYKRGIPTLLLSGRLSPRSFRRYFFFRRFFSPVIRQLTALGMQSPEDAERVVRLGADPRRIQITGNLKRAAMFDDENRANGRPRIDLLLNGKERRRVLVAGSTHRGEEEILMEAFQRLRPSFPDLVLVLAPRHPQRFPEVEKLLEKSGLSYAKRSEMNGLHATAPDVIFLDTLGELAIFYSVADIAFVGGSLVDGGGHNVIEPARFRKPVLFGPHMTNFTAIAEELKRSGGGIEVSGKDELMRELARLLRDPPGAKNAGESAYQAAKGDRKVVERSIELISRYF